MDKKGFFALTDIVAIFLIIMVVTGFMLIFGISSIVRSDKEVIGALAVVESKEYAYALLEMPIGDEGMIFSDLVGKSVEEDDYTELEEFFIDQFSEEDVYWFLGFYDYDDPDSEGLGKAKKIIYRKRWQPIYGAGSNFQKATQKIIIPSYYGEPIFLKFMVVDGMRIIIQDSSR